MPEYSVNPLSCFAYCACVVSSAWHLRRTVLYKMKSCLVFSEKNCIEMANFSFWLGRLRCVFRWLRNSISLRHQVCWMRFPILQKRVVEGGPYGRSHPFIYAVVLNYKSKCRNTWRRHFVGKEWLNKPQNKIFPDLDAEYFNQCRIDGGEAGIKLQGPYNPGAGLRPDYLAHISVFLCSIILCPFYKLNLSGQAKITLHLRVSLFDLV